MITIQPSNNKKLINDLFFNDELVYGFAPNVSTEDKDTKLDFKTQRFFIIWWNKIPVGLCVFYPYIHNFCVAHIGIKEKYRGKKAYDAGRLIIKKLLKLFNGIGVQIRKENRKSLFYALQLGFKFIGETQDHKLLGVNRYGFCRQ